MNSETDIVCGNEKYLTFVVAGQYYCMPVDRVTGLAQMGVITKMPELPQYIKGVADIRGHVTPLIDLNMRLEGGDSGERGRACVVIADIGGKQAGLIVDRVDEVAEFTEGVVIEPPVRQSENIQKLVAGVVNIGGRIVLLLDIDRVADEI